MKAKTLLWCMLGACMLLAGCGMPGDADAEAPEEPCPWTPEEISVVEAENGTALGARIEGDHVTGFEKEGDTCAVKVTVPEDGFYDLSFTLRTLGGFKQNYVYVDGEKVGDVDADGNEYHECVLRRVYMTAGEHTVALVKYWGYIEWDKVTVYTSQPFDESVFSVSAKLVNPNASDNARRLFSYMCDNYGKHILTGQQCDTGMNGWEMIKISENTRGKYPAILGMDMMDYSPSRVENGSSSNAVDLAIKYWEQGGIVTFCWHWNAPSKYITGVWHGAFYTENTNIDLAKIMGGQDPQGYDLLLSDIDAIAVQLQKLEDAGVPVLWRPLHEASGGWFWWGAAGPEAYKELYYLMYDRLVNVHGLDNLIWVWNGQDGDWYPGDAYVDIIGQDIYPGEKVYTSQMEYFLTNQSYADSNKMVVLSENGCLIDPELAQRDRAMWGYYCTWCGDFVMNNSGVVKRYSEQYTELDMLRKVYDSELYISRDELPDLHNYPIRDDAK